MSCRARSSPLVSAVQPLQQVLLAPEAAGNRRDLRREPGEAGGKRLGTDRDGETQRTGRDGVRVGLEPRSRDGDEGKWEIRQRQTRQGRSQEGMRMRQGRGMKQRWG